MILFDHLMELNLNDHGNFWAYSVEILVFANSTSYMFISLGFPLSNWGKSFYFFSLLCVVNMAREGICEGKIATFYL